MHSCDQTGGAWFRSTASEEEHIFYDPGTRQLYKNFGAISQEKIVSLANSKRGYYLKSTYSLGTNQFELSYSDPSAFWVSQPSGALVQSGAITKLLRLDLPS